MKITTASVLIILCLVCVGPLAKVKAVNPPPDGDYPGGNTAEGGDALFNLTTGTYNTALGWDSLASDTEGKFNTAVGAGTLAFNVADNNTATGAGALLNNTTGKENTANGAFALVSSTDGDFNTAIGYTALQNNTTGNTNTAVGDAALSINTTGANNTAIGSDALQGNLTGSGNIALGAGAGTFITTGNNNIDIGNLVGVTGDSATIRIGNVQTRTFIAGINGVAVTGTAVVVDGSGQLGVAPSSKRFKEEIKPMDNKSDAILALKPVTFRYKKEIDPKSTAQFGLVAEEVENVNPDLVVRDTAGKPYSVRYDQVNAMLLNEFLKEHRKVEQLEKQVEALTAGLQKVSAQLQLGKPDTRTVLNNH
jgi:Chaperone of endosialidase